MSVWWPHPRSLLARLRLSSPQQLSSRVGVEWWREHLASGSLHTSFLGSGGVILRDPVHGLLSFESEEAQIIPRLLEAREVQRLRRIKQLGVASVAFPGAEHTRFSHALGTAAVMQKLLRRLRDIDEQIPFWQRVSSEHAQDALAAALLHDLGHGPLSHSLESAFGAVIHHEEWSQRMILDPSTEVNRILRDPDLGRPARVAALVRGEHVLPYLARAVSGTFDVDRCDYLLRDAHFTGVRYGAYDLEWLLRSLRFGAASSSRSDLTGPSLAVDGTKGLVAIEQFLLARLFMFQQVYLHKATRATEMMIRRVLSVAVSSMVDGDALDAAPHALWVAARSQELPLDAYLDLDDIALWSALDAWRNARNPVLADLCQRLRARHLFKTIELHGSDEAADQALERAREIARTHGLDPLLYVALDRTDETVLDEQEDGPLLVVFPQGRPRPLIEVSFLLGRLAGERLRKTRLILAPELREEVTRAIDP